MLKTPDNKIKMNDRVGMEINSSIANEYIIILKIGICNQHGPPLLWHSYTVFVNAFIKLVNGIVIPVVTCDDSLYSVVDLFSYESLICQLQIFDYITYKNAFFWKLRIGLINVFMQLIANWLLITHYLAEMVKMF